MSDPAGHRAVILSVGTELTEGLILNSHLRFLGSELKSLGWRVIRGEQIPDDLALFRQALDRAAGDAELVLITGGLGPTSDDLTREAVAGAAGAELEFQPAVWEDLVRRYAPSGQRLPEPNRRQAFIPRGFTLLENAYGTAPGFCGRSGGALIAALPGPPAELEPMFRSVLLPLLESEFPLRGAGGGELIATALLTPESALEQALARHRLEAVSWGTRVAEDRIAFSLRGGSAGEREQVFQRVTGELGPVCIRLGDVRPSESLAGRLEAQGLFLALAESCTGGMTARMITDLEGSSRVFWGGLVVYSDAAKHRLLGVPDETLDRFGAVSAETAAAMATGLLERTPADVAVAVTGVAGPAGGSPEKPVGTVWICARRRGAGERLRRFRFPGNRDLVRRRSSVAALVMTECLLAGWEFPPVFSP